eukprot:gene5528-4161_t
MQLNAKPPASSLPMQDRVHLIALGKIRELQELRHSSEGKGALGPGGLGQDEGGPGGLEAGDLGPTYWKLLESLSGREGGNGDMEHLGGPGTMEGSYQRPSQLSNADPCPQHRGGVAEGPATSSSDDVSPVSAEAQRWAQQPPAGGSPIWMICQAGLTLPALLVPNLQASPDLVVRTQQLLQTGETPIPRLRLNSLDSPIDFESDLFKGKAYAFIKGLPTTPPGLFDSRKRLSWLCIQRTGPRLIPLPRALSPSPGNPPPCLPQGKFKEALPFNTVITGQEFSRPFLGLPAPWFIEKVLLSLAARINPSLRVGTLSCPSFMMPIISSAQCINISREEFVDLARLSLAFAGTHTSLSRPLNGQPLQFMIKDESSGKYLFNFKICHEAIMLPGSSKEAMKLS